jgi:hypothetical protein
MRLLSAPQGGGRRRTAARPMAQNEFARHIETCAFDSADRQPFQMTLDVFGELLYPEGLMNDPGVAALDPIFYLHHANIDRMWALWNHSSNANPADAGWTNGPPDQSQMEDTPRPATFPNF